MKKSIFTLVKIIVGSALIFTLSNAQASQQAMNASVRGVPCSQCTTEANTRLADGIRSCNTNSNPSVASSCRTKLNQTNAEALRACQNHCVR